MVHPAGKVRLAVDHNFPAPVLKAFAVMMPNVELVPIADIDPALAEAKEGMRGLTTRSGPPRRAREQTAAYAREAMQTAVKLTVEVGDDHVVKLPDEVPVGPAEIIVLVGEPTPGLGRLDDFEPIELSAPVRLSDLVNDDRG